MHIVNVYNIRFFLIFKVYIYFAVAVLRLVCVAAYAVTALSALVAMFGFLSVSVLFYTSVKAH